MKRRTKWLLTILLITGVFVMAYPAAADRWSEMCQSDTIAKYKDAVGRMDCQTMKKAAQEYNAALLEKGNRWQFSEEEQSLYQEILNASEDGMLGYISIPKIEVSIPIYHGTEEEVLQKGAGHLKGSSLPVGGENTHCVVAAHRGLPSSKLFTDLDQLEVGDIFVLHVLNEVLVYEVDQITVVKPDEMQGLTIAEGKDFCTLLTCTPYGVNTHRLMVRGSRVE